MNMRANKLPAAVCRVSATLALLLVAAVPRELRRRSGGSCSARTRRELPAQQADDFDVQLRQVYAPALHVTDRCISCHVGMAPGETGIKGKAEFASHPDVGHDPLQYGCVVCHGGQGRATEKADAHGTAPHWPEPMLPQRYAYAGCGSCHTHLAVPNLTQVARGRALFERYDCLACHSLDERGGTLRPGGAQGRRGSGSLARRWHRLRPRSGTRSISRIAPRRRMGRGAPRSERFRRPIARPSMSSCRRASVRRDSSRPRRCSTHLGCRGCHKIGGVGGDDGPDLTREGEKDPQRLDYSHVPGDKTLGELAGRALPRAGAGRARLADAGARAQRCADRRADVLPAVVAAQRLPGGLLAEGPHPRRAFRASASSPPTARRSSAPSAPPVTVRTAKACAIRASPRSRPSATPTSSPSRPIASSPRP